MESNEFTALHLLVMAQAKACQEVRAAANAADTLRHSLAEANTLVEERERAYYGAVNAVCDFVIKHGGE